MGVPYMIRRSTVTQRCHWWAGRAITFCFTRMPVALTGTRGAWEFIGLPLCTQQLRPGESPTEWDMDSGANPPVITQTIKKGAH